MCSSDVGMLPEARRVEVLHVCSFLSALGRRLLWTTALHGPDDGNACDRCAAGELMMAVSAGSSAPPRTLCTHMLTVGYVLFNVVRIAAPA
jgi:hypothetical protein